MTKVTHLTADEHGGLNRRRLHLREISGDADQPLGTVGQDLRAARLRRGDDLAAVSRALKIRKDHLEAIEEDRLEALPGRTYAVGFVRTYADYLGLESVETVERFKAEIAGRGDSNHQFALTPEPEERRLPQGWIVIAAVLLVFLAYGGYHLARSADNLTGQPVAPVPARIAPKPPAAIFHKAQVPALQTAPLQSAPTAPAASPASGSAAAQAPGINGGQTSGTAPGVGTAPSGRPGGPGASLAAIPAAAPAAQPAVLPPGQVFGAQNRDARVILRAREPTRVLVQGADGAVFINRVLQPGDSYRVPDKVGLTLTTPNGGAVAVELDGQEMGSAGGAGQVTEAMSLDPQAIVDRYSRGGPG